MFPFTWLYFEIHPITFCKLHEKRVTACACQLGDIINGSLWEALQESVKVAQAAGTGRAVTWQNKHTSKEFSQPLCCSYVGILVDPSHVTHYQKMTLAASVLFLSV